MVMATMLNRPKKPLDAELRKIFASPRLFQAVKDLFDAVPGDYNSLVTEINLIDDRVTVNEAAISDHEDRISVLEPQYEPITSADSPYQILEGDVLLVDKSGGDVTLLLPTTGSWFKFAVKSDLNTLTVSGTVSGETDTVFYFEGTGRQAVKVDGEWWWI